MKLIKSQLLKNHKGSWIIKTSECLIFSSKTQISGILNTNPPFYTYAYWDDPLLMTSVSTRPLVVLGSGILSYLPQIRQRFPNLKITHVEKDEEIFTVSQQIGKDEFISNQNDMFINIDAYELDFAEYINHNFFIDIYDHEGIHPNTLSEKFLTNLSRNAHIAAFNVFDTKYPSLGTSTLFYSKLKPYFKYIFYINRENSNTIFCFNSQSGIEERLSAEILNNPYLDLVKISSPDLDIFNDLSLSILKFTPEDTAKKHSSGPFKKIEEYFSSLSPMDLLRASRNNK